MELKPCPFCGSRDVEMFDAGGDPYSFSMLYVHCNNCNADSKMCDSIDDAVAAWNRRAIDVDALREVVAEIEDADVDGSCDWAERIRQAVGL